MSLAIVGLAHLLAVAATPTGHGVYSRLEATFELPGLQGNPFDFTVNDVQATFRSPDGREVTRPAFFDGGSTWRARLAPDRAGTWRLATVTRNGQAVSVSSQTFTVTGEPQPGYLRVAADGRGFVFDDGAPYYPLGCNIGWGNRDHDVPYYLTRLGEAGINWSRVWMTHFDSRNLEWTYDGQPAIGQLSLKAAARWDAIIAAAEAQGIHLQMVLQHHGQYSTRTNPNWSQNPFNQANGGFLATPDQFFSDPRAIALTKAKYRYIIARWGYSPAVLAWELFNEVQYTDGTRDANREAVGRWHRDMAAFLRSQDANHHLVTTSSDLSLPIWDATDYDQPHTYPSDPVTAIAGVDPTAYDNPIFYGEIGPGGLLNKDDGRYLHRILWAGLMSTAAGGAQYWTWDQVEKADLYQHFTGATRFLSAAGLAGRRMVRAEATAETPALGALTFGPAGGWGEPGPGEITVGRDGQVDGLADLPGFLHGQYHKDRPTVWKVRVDFPSAGTFGLALDRIARAGAILVLAVDGAEKLRQEFPKTDEDQLTDARLRIDVPAGQHTITVSNLGQDWVIVHHLTLDPYAAAVSVLAKRDDGEFVAWLYRGDPEDLGEHPTKATVTVPALQPGAWQITFWETYRGEPSGEQEVTVGADGRGVIEVPAVGRDLAILAKREP